MEALVLEPGGQDVKLELPTLWYIQALVSNVERLTPEYFPEMKRKKSQQSTRWVGKRRGASV